VNGILYVFSGITFHSIPYDQFQIGGHIFTIAKFHSYAITYGRLQKDSFLGFLKNISHISSEVEPISFDTQSVGLSSVPSC